VPFNHRLIVTLLLCALSLTGCGDSSPPSFDRTTLFQGVNFVGVSVSDLAASTTRHKEIVAMDPLPLQTISQAPALLAVLENPMVEFTAQLLRGANAQLLLMEFADTPHQNSTPTPVIGPGIAHVCYQVNKTTNTYQRFLEAGATPIGDVNLVQLNSHNPVEYGYIRDSDGIVIEVEHVDVAALDLPEPPSNDYRIRHVSLATPDLNRMVRFYGKLLNQPNPRRAGRFISLSGQKLDQVSGLPQSKIQMAWFQTRNLELELIQYESHPTKPPKSPRPVEALGYNMIVFEVLNLNAARDRLVAAGGSIALPSTPFLGGHISLGRDTDGNLVGLHASDPQHPLSARNFARNGT